MTAEPSGLTGSWLAARWGTQPARIEAMRQAGGLVGVRRADGQIVYPPWQFGFDARPLAALPQVLAAAREAGLDEARLNDLLTMRAGLTGERRLADALRAGDVDGVVRAIRSAPPRAAKADRSG
jgi:hypothetical protein